jgi:hypothetical protein
VPSEDAQGNPPNFQPLSPSALLQDATLPVHGMGATTKLLPSVMPMLTSTAAEGVRLLPHVVLTEVSKTELEGNDPVQISKRTMKPVQKYVRKVKSNISELLVYQGAILVHWIQKTHQNMPLLQHSL